MLQLLENLVFVEFPCFLFFFFFVFFLLLFFFFFEGRGGGGRGRGRGGLTRLNGVSSYRISRHKSLGFGIWRISS